MALLEIQSPNDLDLKPQQNCPEYSGLPNIYGAINAYHAPFYSSTGALQLGGNVTGHGPNGTATGGAGSENFYISAAISSSLYQENLNEVRVNALFGLSLIRAY